MFNNFDDMRDFGKKRFETVAAATSSTARGLRAIASEANDYSSKSLEDGRAFAAKLLRARRLDEIVDLQSSFMKTSYDEFVERSAKMRKLYAEVAQEAFDELTGDVFKPAAPQPAPKPAPASPARAAAGGKQS